ncbi:MAG: formylglycine-generating enzyme family protein [Bacteroides sp.]|nr:formylglycine-generating enzyme family protein [Bacteroides sp.]
MGGDAAPTTPAVPVPSQKNVETFTVNGITFEMVRVDGGTFMMGSNDDLEWEKPVHSETVSTFYIGKTEVTQALWTAVMGSNPSYYKGQSLPVEKVSWNDCQEFIDRLNRITGRNFRLPTEAEWEYAARGGNRSRGYEYSGSNNIESVGWYEDNSGDSTHPVGSKLANELGLYDMSGNVWEWTSDLWSDSYSSYRNGGSSGSHRVFRGGSYDNGAGHCRSADRHDYDSGRRYGNLGFRLAL